MTQHIQLEIDEIDEDIDSLTFALNRLKRADYFGEYENRKLNKRRCTYRGGIFWVA